MHAGTEVVLTNSPEGNTTDVPLLTTMTRDSTGDEHVTNGLAAVASLQVLDRPVQVLVFRSSGNVVERGVVNNRWSAWEVTPVGVGAEAIQISRDGYTAFVLNAFDHSIARFELRSVGNRLWSGHEQVLSLRRTIAPSLDAKVERGRVLFHSVDRRLTRRGAISCASCHPGGGDDGTTWRFAEGPRQSPPLWGGITATAPFHWDQAVRDMADISRVTIEGRMGGNGLGADEMDDLGAYLDSLPTPPPPPLNEAQVERGRALFESAETQCLTCHPGEAGTDGRVHDVGTGRGVAVGETEDAFATPVLRGLAFTAPYLHDGSAGTLRELVETTIATDRMGKGSHLSAAQRQDLAVYLQSR